MATKILMALVSILLVLGIVILYNEGVTFSSFGLIVGNGLMLAFLLMNKKQQKSPEA